VTTVARLDDEIPYTELTIFGEKIKVRTEQNFFNLLRAFDPDDPAQLAKYLIGVVHPDDEKPFITLMAQQRNLTADDLMEVFADITEAQSEGHPTKPASASRTSSRPRAASKRLTAG
jgi:hypothetical protein